MLPPVAVMNKLVAAKVPAVWVMDPEAVRLMVLVPVSAMLLPSARSPVMLAVTLPLPLMALSMLVLTERLKVSWVLFDNVTLDVLPNVPVLPPLPTCRVPPVMFVAPL